MSLNIIIQVFRTIFFGKFAGWPGAMGPNGDSRRAGGRARSDAEEALEDSLSHGQTYVRDIQWRIIHKFLVPGVIVNSGYRWHNAANCNEMMQILSVRTALHRRQLFSNSFIPV